jgi:hypothetical protein
LTDGRRNGQWRVTKDALPDFVPAGTVPGTLTPHPDAVFALYAELLAGQPPAIQQAVMALARQQLGLGEYRHSDHYGISYRQAASVYDSVLGKNSPGAQAIYSRIVLPVRRYIGLAWEVVERVCSYKHELDYKNPAIPDEFIALTKPTGQQVVVEMLPPPTPPVAPPSGFDSDRIGAATPRAVGEIEPRRVP